ncbi:MAG: DUF4037 domain-containing protein [Anaerolineae bacterium]
MPIPLPDHATDASRRRAERALELARSCPPELADEMALTGSTAHGFADDESDLELNLWVTAIPPLAARIDWLRASGASDIEAEDVARSDQSWWISFRIGDIPAEIGWQTFDALRDNLERILSGAASERGTLVIAEIIASAIPLRAGARLAEWQTRLRGYSDAVQRAIIDSAVARWSHPGHRAALLRLARHGERIALTERLLADVDMAARVLYAVHRRWEPSRKWTLTAVRDFAPELPARIDAILGDPSLERRVELCARLCRDALALAPETVDVSAALAALRSESD